MANTNLTPEHIAWVAKWLLERKNSAFYRSALLTWQSTSSAIHSCRQSERSTDTETPELVYLSGLLRVYEASLMGLLLAVVREAWGDPLLVVEPQSDFDEWHCYSGPRNNCCDLLGRGPTEGEALVAALKAAPDRS